MKNRELINNSYEKYISAAEKFVKKNKYNEAFTCLYYASAIQYAFQMRLWDERIENLLKDIYVYLINLQPTILKETEDCILLYDSICNDRAALTLQYIRALEQMEVVYHYVVLGDCSRGKEIVDILNKSNKGVLHIIPSGLTYCKKCEKLHSLLIELRPKAALLHCGNMDVVGACVWSSVKGVQRFYINHGDEQFWIGTKSFDYLLCFRGMGVNTAVKYRGIDASKCLIQPYYPIISDVPFQGFDFDIPSDSIVLFSGGRFIKIYGEKNEFSNMIAEILSRNKNTFFIFAGSGNERPFIEELKKKGVDGRCRVISYRRDLAEMMKHVDIYLGTYPQSGGLMAQYAANAAVPIVERDSMVGGVSEDLLPKLKQGIVITYKTLGEYYDRVAELVSSKKMRREFGKELNTGLLSEKEFKQNLRQILVNHKSDFSVNEKISNVSLRSERLISADNQYIHRLWGMQLNKYMLKASPLIFIKAMVMHCRYFGLGDFMNKAMIKSGEQKK